MPASFNLIDLYQQVWGLAPTLVVGRIPTTVQDEAGILASNALYNASDYNYPTDFKSIPVVSSSAQVLATSTLGTPITEQITFTVPDQKNGDTLVTKGFTYPFPGWPLFDVTGANVIEKTPNRGHRGTVKEFIYEDDYQVTIRGFLINDADDSYPKALLKNLMQVINAKVAVGVASAVLNDMDINQLVIEHWSFPTLEGFPNIQPFELNCISDVPEPVYINGLPQKNINPHQ